MLLQTPLWPVLLMINDGIMLVLTARHFVPGLARPIDEQLVTRGQYKVWQSI